MNSFLNIQVRVTVARARAALQALRKDIQAINFASATAGAVGFATAWSRMGLDRIGSRVQWLGRQIEYNFTLPLLLAGGAATKMALDNEKAFTRIIKVYGDGAHNAEFYKEEVEALGRAFEALSNRFGIAQKDALNIAADWAAAGASGLALAKSVKLTMETMILGELEAANATKSLIAIQAQYGLSIDELTEAIHILNMVENQTGISMAGLIDGFARAAGVARSSGVSIRELAADLAALTPATGSAANAGNALKTIFSRLLSPTNEAAEALRLMGININDLGWQTAGAQQKLLIMAKAFQGLSDAQKGLVSSIIASRYQINRFEVLMRELISTNSYYHRAIEATADMTRVYNQAQHELNTVLSSSPNRLRILWTMLQNASANIIQPLIPALLWLAEALQRAVTAFSNLNPSIQKLVLFGLGLLIIVGPLVRYIGALQVLVYELAAVFMFLLTPLKLVWSAFNLLILLPIKQFFVFLPVVIRGAIVSSLAVLATLPKAFSVAMVAIQSALIVGTKIARDIWRMWLVSMSSLTIFFGNFLAGIWRVIMFTVTTITSSAMITLRILYIKGLVAIQTVLLAFAAWSGRMWRLITMAPLLFIRQMWAGIVALFTRALPTLRIIGTAIFTAITSPWGAAAVFIIGLIVLFWDEIKQIWNNLVNWFRSNGQQIAGAFRPLGDAAVAVHNVVVKAFNALPEGIKNALLAVVRIIRAAVEKVYELFSYLNPWARHSPSLVESVTTGVEEIKRQYESLTGVGSAFAQAAKDLEIFKKASLEINRSVERNRYKEIRAELVRLAADAVPAFDRLIARLFVLKDQLAEVERALEAQREVVDKLREELDEANDALDKQKDILQSMKEEADKYEEAINRINGDLEVLTGTREALRQAGAGSDILAEYDKQIEMLQEQKKGINDQLDAARQAYQNQQRLVDQLTAARDKLQESYDEEYKKLQIIDKAYDKIRDKIQDITFAINDFAMAVDQLNQKGSSLGSAFDAAAGGDFPDVGGSGMLGREGGLADQAALIDQFTKDLAEQTKNMFGAFDFLEPIKRAWEKVKNWLRENVGPLWGIVTDAFKAAFDNIPNPFKSEKFQGFIQTAKDIWNSIVGFFKQVWDLIGPPIKDIGKLLKEEFGDAIEKIWPEIEKFKDLIEPMGQMFRNLWEAIKPVAAIIGGILLLALNILIHVLKNALKPVLEFIVEVIAGVIRIFRGLIEFIVGVFTGNWELAWQGIKDIFGGVWDIIWSTLQNAGELIWGVVKGIVDGIVSFFQWLWDVLVGHSIIPDLVDEILGWFTKLKDKAKEIWDAFMAALQWIWDNVLSPIFNKIKEGIDKVREAFRTAIDKIKEYWDRFKSHLSSAYDRAKEIIQKIKDKFGDIVTGIKDAVGKVKQWIDDFVSKISGLRSRISGAFSGLFDGLKNAFKSAINWIIGKWNNLSFSLGPVTVSTPNLPFLAEGGITNGIAIVGEGRRAYPEYVIPTDPQYRRRALMLFESLGRELGIDNVLGSRLFQLLTSQLSRGTRNDSISFYATGGILGRASIRGSAVSGAMLIAPVTNHSEYHFHGDLVFPNVRDGSDVEEFINNLRALSGR